MSALEGLPDDATRLQDRSGNIIGVVVSRRNALGVARATDTIPQNINFAIKGSVARMGLEIHGVPYGRANRSEKLATQAIADMARGYTVGVRCCE